MSLFSLQQDELLELFCLKDMKCWDQHQVYKETCQHYKLLLQGSPMPTEGKVQYISWNVPNLPLATMVISSPHLVFLPWEKKLGLNFTEDEEIAVKNQKPAAKSQPWFLCTPVAALIPGFSEPHLPLHPTPHPATIGEKKKSDPIPIPALRSKKEWKKWSSTCMLPLIH